MAGLCFVGLNALKTACECLCEFVLCAFKSNLHAHTLEKVLACEITEYHIVNVVRVYIYEKVVIEAFVLLLLLLFSFLFFV